MTNTTRPNNIYSNAPMRLSQHEVKKLVGAALTSTDGILDEEDSLIDFFKGEDNPTRGIAVHIDGNNAEVSAKVIVEAGRDVEDVLSRAAEKVTDNLSRTAGLNVTRVDIKAVDTMSRAHYDEMYENAGKSPVCPTK